MEFRTYIDIPQTDFQINHHLQMMLFGSCFAENIGQRLIDSKFTVNVNPFGILYNPLSISKVIQRIILNQPFTEDDVIECNGLYVSFMHHGSFSSTDKSDILGKINAALNKASDDLQESDILLITFGTSYVYSLKNTGEVVANCHKFHSSVFNRTRVTVTEIVENWSCLLNKLRQQNQDLKIVFTVSPIRHWKDGAHDNQLSKATLLLAIEELQQKYDNLYYFPSYEILMDELRDYRFYAEDMIHPNKVAVDYIWKRFGDIFFNDETKKMISEWTRLKQSLLHRPFNTETNQHKQFLRQTLLKIEQFQDKYTYINCGKEISTLNDQLS